METGPESGSVSRSHAGRSSSISSVAIRKSRLRRTGEFTARVHHIDDFNAGFFHPIEDNVIRVGDDFSQARNARAHAIHVEVFCGRHDGSF